MKNVLKKILCILLCLTLSLTVVFALAACDPEMSDAEKEALRKELLKDLSVDLTRGEANVTMLNPMGLSTQLNVVWEVTAADEDDATPILNADVIYVETETSSAASVATVMLLRGDDVYGTSKTLTISGSDKIAGVKNQMSTIIPELEHKTMEELLELLASQTGADLSALGGMELPELGDGADTSALSTALAAYFTKLSVTSNGYKISFSADKLVDDLWNVVYALAQIIDQNKTVTLNALYASNQFKAIVAEANITAAQMEAAINQIIEKVGDESGEGTDDESGDEPAEKLEFAALPAEKDETLYHYLGRYLAIEIDEGVTVGSLTIGDLLALAFGTGEAPDLTDTLDAAKKEVLPDLKKMINAYFKIELNFTLTKQLENIHVKLMGMIDVTIKPLDSVTLTTLA